MKIPQWQRRRCTQKDSPLACTVPSVTHRQGDCPNQAARGGTREALPSSGCAHLPSTQSTKVTALPSLSSPSAAALWLLSAAAAACGDAGLIGVQACDLPAGDLRRQLDLDDGRRKGDLAVGADVGAVAKALRRPVEGDALRTLERDVALVIGVDTARLAFAGAVRELLRLPGSSRLPLAGGVGERLLRGTLDCRLRSQCRERHTGGQQEPHELPLLHPVPASLSPKKTQNAPVFPKEPSAQTSSMILRNAGQGTFSSFGSIFILFLSESMFYVPLILLSLYSHRFARGIEKRAK